MKRTLTLSLSLMVLASMILSACGGNVPAASSGGTAIITFVQQPTTLNPLYANQWFSTITTQFFLKSLWSFNQNNNPVPEIAVEVPSAKNGGISEDGLTMTIKLRDDVTWSDGEPVTAKDFVFTYDMYMAESNIVATRYPYEDYVSSMEARDDHTLVVNFTEPFAGWLALLFQYGVLPEHVLQPVFEKDGTIDNAEWNHKPTVGVGPFVFKEWEADSHIIFEANPKWIRPPKLQQIFIRMADDEGQEVAILAGETDIGAFLDWSQADTINKSGVAKFMVQPAGYDEGWYLNFDPETAHPALQDVNVRKALVLATDREKITKDLLGGQTVPAATFWDSTPPYGNTELKPYPYDPEEAKRLLDEAGWVDSNGDGTRDKDGKELVLRYIANDRQLRKDVQAVVQQMWAQVGIGAELKNYGDDFFNGFADGGPLAVGDFDVAEWSDAPNFPDPDRSDYWSCSDVTSAENPDGANSQDYCNPALDELFAKQATETDPEARQQLYFQIGKLMYDEVVWVGLWKDPDLWSVSNRLQGVKFSGATPFWNAHEWSISK